MGAENNFMEYAQIVFYQLVIFVIYGAIGVAAVKGGILDEAGLHAVSRVVIKVHPAVMLFTNTVSGVTREKPAGIASGHRSHRCDVSAAGASVLGHEPCFWPAGR